MIRVVVVDGSATHRAHLVQALEHDGDIAVVGVAATAAEAVGEIGRRRPDLATVDLGVTGGVDAIARVMATTPLPLLALSAVPGGPGSAPAVEALAAGAVDVMPKPSCWSAAHDAELRRTVRILRGVLVVTRRDRRRPAPTAPVAGAATGAAGGPLVALAASTGGPGALATVLAPLADLPAPIVVVQHLHPSFVDGLVAWLGRVIDRSVTTIRSGAPLVPGVVHVAPGGVHCRVVSGAQARLDRAAPDDLHVPSADVLFSSVAAAVGPAGVGVVLTGMGDDGCRGLLDLRRVGAMTIAQDAATSVVHGMPGAAVDAGAAAAVLPVELIADEVWRAVGAVA